jgi:hypothetical protein
MVRTTPARAKRSRPKTQPFAATSSLERTRPSLEPESEHSHEQTHLSSRSLNRPTTAEEDEWDDSDSSTNPATFFSHRFGPPFLSWSNRFGADDSLSPRRNRVISLASFIRSFPLSIVDTPHRRPNDPTNEKTKDETLANNQKITAGHSFSEM